MQLEPFSRKIIDRFTLSMYNLFNKLELASYELVEFWIASAGDPVEILRDGSCTSFNLQTFFLLAFDKVLHLWKRRHIWRDHRLPLQQRSN